MKIQNLKIKNFKVIDEEQIDLQGRSVFLLGPNGVGKSSIIEAAFGQMPGEPLKHLASKGEVSIELSDKDGVKYKCTFKFSKTNQKPSLTIEDENGEVVKKPATVFSELFNITDFDIDSFLRLSTTKQIDQIKNLSGIDWSDIDAEYKKLYDERTFKNRKSDELSKKLTGTTFSKDLKPYPQSVDELLKKYEIANNANDTHRRGELALSDIESKIKSKIDEIESLKLKILSIEAEVDSCNVKKKEIIEWLKENPLVSTDGIKEEIDKAKSHNEAYSKNEQVRALKNDLEGLTFEILDIEKRMSDIKELKRKQLIEAQQLGKIPVKGLSIDEDSTELRIDGIPFDQVNTAKKIIAGLEIQAALLSDGKVRIARFDGSLLDNKSLSEVLEWAKSKDIQLFIEMVERNSERLTIQIDEQ